MGGEGRVSVYKSHSPLHIALWRCSDAVRSVSHAVIVQRILSHHLQQLALVGHGVIVTKLCDTVRDMSEVNKLTARVLQFDIPFSLPS